MNPPIKGRKALGWGEYEAWRLWGTAWPLLLAVGVTLVAELATDLGEISTIGGAALALIAKALQQYVTNNSGKKL